MEGKLLGLGLANIFGLFLLFIFLIVIAKVVTLKYEKTPTGVREFIQSI